MRILLVEDDAKIAAFILKGLKAAGFAVDHVTDGEAGLDMASSEPYDAAVIDVMLPGRDGLSLVARLRRDGIRIPVLILSARGEVRDRVKGLETGADDYLTKPFAFSELLARIQALIRRASAVPKPRTSPWATSPWISSRARCSGAVGPSNSSPWNFPCWPIWPATPAAWFPGP